ncbi:hypothetical protein ASD56_05485 [Microbacterium sp. Root166]|uniref:RDD family protein n=1 Tax=Microbacterium sp. Root166 TaxID=1736478 RepID=UPI0006F639E3|nr:RDD family protein [Microbacterium sp. Root166]KQZ85742.1 hypothetical protein ASD56_05485 [Microbacterium sp. Root166]
MTSRPLSAAATATLGRRAAAYAVDAAVACAVGVFAAAITVGVALALGAGRAVGAGSLGAALVLAAGAAVLALLVWAVVYSAMQGGTGSVGQRALDLRLLDDRSPEAIGFWRALWRNVVWALSCSVVIGWFTPLFDPSTRHQGWHDTAGRAILVDTRGTDAAAPRPAAEQSPVAAPLAASPPLTWFIDRPAPPLPQRAPAASQVPSPAPAPEPAPAPVLAPVAVPVLAPVHVEAPAPEFAPRVEPSYAPAAARTAAPAAGPVRAAAVATASAPPTAIITQVPMTRPVTAISVPLPETQGSFVAGAPVIAVLTWDDATSMAVYGRTVYGRNPIVEPGIVSVPVRDETLSLSKTHFEVGGDAGGAWIADRYSTNGTVIVRDGSRHLLIPGLPTALRTGDRLELGDRVAIVGTAP